MKLNREMVDYIAACTAALKDTEYKYNSFEATYDNKKGYCSKVRFVNYANLLINGTGNYDSDIYKITYTDVNNNSLIITFDKNFNTCLITKNSKDMSDYRIIYARESRIDLDNSNYHYCASAYDLYSRIKAAMKLDTGKKSNENTALYYEGISTGNLFLKSNDQKIDLSVKGTQMIDEFVLEMAKLKMKHKKSIYAWEEIFHIICLEDDIDNMLTTDFNDLVDYNGVSDKIYKIEKRAAVKRFKL